MITVWGSPDCGKTVTALKLAQEIYQKVNEPVLFLSTDLSIPSLGFIFPNEKNDDVYSVGVALDKVDIFEEDILRQLVVDEKMKSLGYLGYKLGDTEYTYPKPTADKVEALFRAMEGISEYIIIDCTSDKGDIITNMALKRSDYSIRLINTDLKSMCWFANAGNNRREGSLLVVNTKEGDIFSPIDDVKKHCEGAEVVIPYSAELKKQSITGTLSERIKDKKYIAALQEIITRLSYD